MINSLHKGLKSSPKEHYDFSILIPSWNNLEYLKLCIEGLLENCSCHNQIIIIINEGKDGTKEWVENHPKLDYIYSPNNIGICYALNSVRSLILSEYVLYMNDDMYPLPHWDLNLKNEILNFGRKDFMFSSTMIEPIDTNNPCVLVKDYGDSIANFNKKQLLNDLNTFEKQDWLGSTWPPNVVHIDVWDLVGGMSIEFTPGFSSDPDLSLKLYKLGVREFKGLGNSFVYHFGCKSTGRVNKNDGNDTFLLKWGISSRIFTSYYLKRGQKYNGSLSEPKLSSVEKSRNFIKTLKTVLKR